MKLEPTITTFAKGGGCFLAGTTIETPQGMVSIEDFQPGDLIYSFNQETGDIETSTVERLEVLAAREYYVINGTVEVTGEHPFFVNVDGKLKQRKVADLKFGDMLVTKEGLEPIKQIRIYKKDVVIYNLINVTPNHNYYAAGYLVHNKGGGGCFLSGTQIKTPTGSKKIEKIRPLDVVVSFNEKNNANEYSTVLSVQIFKTSGYYILNDSLKVTSTHPLYIKSGDKIETKEVASLKIGDNLITDIGYQTIYKIEFIYKEVVVYNLINVEPNHNYYANNYLVHNKGSSSGGRGGSSSSAKSSSSSKSSSSTPSNPPAGKSTSKPGSTIKTADGKTIKSSADKPKNAGFSREKGIVGDNGYQPRFSNGYSAPAGSTVYYRDTSALDYLPWIYLFSHNNPATPAGAQATVVQPDGKQVDVKPVQEGTDGLAIFNWFLLIVIVVAIIGGIIYGVNKYTSRDKTKSKSSYGW